MAQLIYRYGAMSSGKSIEILKVQHNYKEQGKDVLLMTSSIDTRSGVGKVSSRIGISSEAHIINPEDDLTDTIRDYLQENYWRYQYDEGLYCILIDEAQFLSREQVKQLADVVDFYDIPVICYGLKNDFRNELFDGSEALLVYSDKIEEIKTICWYCNRKSTMNGRFVNGVLVTQGEQIMIGDEEYKPLCRACFNKHNM